MKPRPTRWEIIEAPDLIEFEDDMLGITDPDEKEIHIWDRSDLHTLVTEAVLASLADEAWWDLDPDMDGQEAHDIAWLAADIVTKGYQK